MKILVTGANGQVGRSLKLALTKQAIEHLALFREQLDISDNQAVVEAISNYQPDIVINAAAYTAVDKAETEPQRAFQVNRDGPENLARACSSTGAAIFHLSTDYVFAGNGTQAYSEENLTAPQSVYGQSKLEGELAVAKANPNHIILRTAWVFGEHGNNFVKTMLRLGRDREQLNIVADQVGGPTYAGDIVNTLLTIAQIYATTGKLAWGTYHFSGLPHCSWYDFAREIFEQADQQGLYLKASPLLSPIATADYPTPAKRPANSSLDCDKIQRAFGIRPSNWRRALTDLAPYKS